MSEILLYKTANQTVKLEVLIQDETLWLTQIEMAELFSTTKQNISSHIQNIFDEGELGKEATVKNFLTVRQEGKRSVNRNLDYYNLDMIISVGYRVNSSQATQFRIWATKVLKEYIIKGFAMDDERLKNPAQPFGKDYFDELLERIRDIRASEKRFYQKVRDLFMLSHDYDKSDKATQLFFAEAQNKLIYAITGQTAAELIVSRANAQEPNMALTSFKGSIVRKQDIYISKNYLSADELDSLNRFVVVFLETAELRAKNRQEITMDFWRENIDRIIEFNDKKVLQGHGSVSREQMVEIADAVYETFEANRKVIEAQQADADDMEEIRQLEAKVKARK